MGSKAKKEKKEKKEKKAKKVKRDREGYTTEARAERKVSAGGPPALGRVAARADGRSLPAQRLKREKKAKKKERAKGGPAGNGAAPAAEAVLAAVGDRDLARSGPAFEKCFYAQHADVTEMPAAEIAALRKERMTVVEHLESRPVTSFAHLDLDKKFLHACRTFQQPSPIQAECWPLALSGHDVVGIAATGSGKTLAFGLPAMVHIAAQLASGAQDKGRKGPVALVMGPTRELVIQIAEVLEEAGRKCGVRTTCVYGGVSKEGQRRDIGAGFEVVVATPGRLRDLMEEGVLSLHKVTYLVLDEADRMLDMGFLPEIRAVANQIRADRQTMMFSATWPMEVSNLAADFLRSPFAKVNIGSPDLAASHTIKQIVEVCQPDMRDGKLLKVLGKYHASRKNRCLIFVLYKKEAARVEAFLQRKGYRVVAVHGDMGQRDRVNSVNQFQDGSVPLLVATDVAARGLDIPDVEYVINYSFPLTTEDYVHRIGRTGRAGKSGVAHTFFTINDKARSGELIGVLREAKQTVPDDLMAFGTTVKKKESKLYGAHFKDIDMTIKPKKTTFD